jgi:trimethylamine--corrinoid protein Co-methyltransferase
MPLLELLSPEQIELIHLGSLDILENVGIRWLDDEALTLWEQAGANVDRSRQHAWLDRGLVLKLVAQAPPAFTWRARNPARNLRVGENALTFIPGSGMVFASNKDIGRQTGRSQEYAQVMKLSQMCNVIHTTSISAIELHDVPVSLRHLRRHFMAYTLSDKASWGYLHGRVICDDILEMARLVFGPDLTTGGPVTGGVINVNTPLVFDKRMLGGLITMARAGQMVIITPFVLAGATSPVTVAAAAAQQNAEVLAGVALTQLVRPGTPTVYGAFLTNVDLRSGGPAFGSPEAALAISIGAQLARRYQLPHRGSGMLTSSNVVDAQAAFESGWSLWPTILSGTHVVLHAAGWMEAGLTFSFEKFIIDMENLAMMRHYLAGVEITPENLALASIAEVGPGGHHFGTAHTLARFQSAFYAPTVADRRNIGTWQEAGAPDVVERAYHVWKAMLAQYQPPPLDPAIHDALTGYVTRRERELADVDLYSDG